MLKMSSFWMVYAVVAFLLCRVVLRKARPAELLLPGVVLLSFVLIQAQMSVEGGLGGIMAFFDMPIFWRYHLPTWPLLMIVVAFAICELSRMVPRRFALPVVLALTVLVVGESARKYCKFERRWGDELRAMAKADAWAAEIIRADWKGPGECARTWNPHIYNSDRRPLVVDAGGFLAYQVGGSCPESKESDNTSLWPKENPNYMFLPEGCCEPYVRWYLKNGGEVMAERVFGGRRFTLYRMR